MVTEENPLLEIGDVDRPSTWTRPPSWLRLPASSPPPPPPIDKRPSLLPVDAFTWEDFERLCLRVLELEAETVHVEASDHPAGSTKPVTRLYGNRGQAQHGIDIYSRDPLVLGQTPSARRYVCLQARRVKRVTKTAVNGAVSKFLKGKWSKVSRKFIYATSRSGAATQLSDEIEQLAARLARLSIEFELWDQEKLSIRLKTHPGLVDDFFGRSWVETFCGHEAAAGLGPRLDAHQAAKLRSGLARIYQAAFGIADSGLLALRLEAQQTVSLHERFVTPDLLSTTPHEASATAPPTEPMTPTAKASDVQTVVTQASLYRPRGSDDADWSTPITDSPEPSQSQPQERWTADAWVGQDLRQAIVGEPGAGKSTLLRFLVLDLLSGAPTWVAAAERWGQRLPIWLPFHFFTQRVAGQTGKEASIGAALKAWLEQHDVEEIWPLVESALADERLLLVVDGLDEWVDDEAGRYAAAALETFASSHSAAVVVSTRPYGLSKLTLGAAWTYARIAPLSRAQQKELAERYFRVAASSHDQQPTDAAVARSVDGFLAEVHDAPDLRALSGIPLFLVLLIGLRLSNVAKLPDRRFDVYDRAVQLLIAEHPAKRRAAAAITAQRQRLLDRQIRALLAEVAFISQERGDTSTISQETLRRDLIQALRNPDNLAFDAGTANLAADELLDVAEGELGVLVRQGPAELGFLHRVLQEQLAAEYATDRLSPNEQQALFEEHVGDPRWHEVLLAVMWRLRRPTELRTLVNVIRSRIEETPAGLHAREIFAEVTLGPYSLPGADVQQFAPELIDIVETHPYPPHRARLLDSVFAGWDNVTAAALVESTLARWTVLTERPSANLMWHLAQLASHGDLGELIVMLLLRGIRHSDGDVAYGAAISIAMRCSHDGPGDEDDRQGLKTGLFRILADPPSGVSQAAALVALALEWHEDVAVRKALGEARGSRDEGVRVVALSAALGTLRSVFVDEDANLSPQVGVEPVTDDERKWLAERLAERETSNAHGGLLLAAISEAVRDEPTVLGYCLGRMERGVGPDLDLIWRTALSAFGDDDRVADLLCRQLRTEERPWPLLGMRLRDGRPLARAYGPGTRHQARVASAIEDHIRTFGAQYRDVELFELAEIDRGERMKEALLKGLKTSSFPHWVAAALARYFFDEADVLDALKATLAGDPARASQIANVAPEVLGREAVPRLLEILRQVSEASHSGRARFDIVASALIRSCQEQGLMGGEEIEAIAAESLDLMPKEPDRFAGDPSYDLAVAFFPAEAAQSALRRLAASDNHLITPFLRVFRDNVQSVQPYLEESARIIRSLPANHRSRLCQLMANRTIAPEAAMSLTQQWADEVADSNKSVASLAYHRALLEGRTNGLVDDKQWEAARVHLAEQASCYGPDHEARRRAAWVGMCVLDDWSMLSGLNERIGDPHPVGVPLSEPLHGPDLVLLQQIASRWQHLRIHFGESLVTRLSGLRGGRGDESAWNSLALVASQSQSLENDLQDAVTSDPALLKQDGALAWFASRPGTTAEVVSDALLAHLRPESNVRNVATFLLADPERIHLDRGDLRPRLEAAAREFMPWGSPALETLAVLFPDHSLVRDAWRDFYRIISADEERAEHVESGGPHPHTYLAVAYAAVDSEEILWLIQRDLRWMEDRGETFFDDAFVRHVARRLRRDPVAVKLVGDAVADPTTTDTDAAVLVSLLAAAVTPDESLTANVHQRIDNQRDVTVAPIVRDRVIGTSVSAKTLLTRVADFDRHRV
jgi:hypothetical protein